MDKVLLRSQAALDSCRRHLEESKSWNSEIESYLTEHLLVVMCADVQQEIYRVIERRAERAGDAALKSYAVATCKRVLRSVGKKDIAKFVGNFGRDAQAYLNEHVDDAMVTIYNNAVDGRHNVAHKFGANLTFRELERALGVAKDLIGLVEKAIALGR